jgi:hypothetical protein
MATIASSHPGKLLGRIKTLLLFIYLCIAIDDQFIKENVGIQLTFLTLPLCCACYPCDSVSFMSKFSHNMAFSLGSRPLPVSMVR